MKPTLDSTRTDVAAALARGVVAACPVIGGLIAEAVNQLIPNQKLDRVVDYLQLLDNNIARLDNDLEFVKKHLQDEYALDLFEDSVVQASRAVTEERRRRLANLLARSLSREELQYAESKKLLNLLQELTDPELLFLAFYSNPPTVGSEYHKQLREKNPQVLRPASREVGIPQEEVDRGALQESYKNTLLRLGLLQEQNRTLELTSLGKLLFRYIEDLDGDGEGDEATEA